MDGLPGEKTAVVVVQINGHCLYLTPKKSRLPPLPFSPQQFANHALMRSPYLINRGRSGRLTKPSGPIDQRFYEVGDKTARCFVLQVAPLVE